MKFLDEAKRYMGVPYAKKYWKPEGESISDVPSGVSRISQRAQAKFSHPFVYHVVVQCAPYPSPKYCMDNIKRPLRGKAKVIS